MIHPRQPGRPRRPWACRLRIALFAPGLAFAPSALPLPAQGVPGSAGRSAADAAESPRSLQAREDARSEARAAQVRFERLRRQWSPARRHPWLGSECDERVGRICLRYDEGGDWWPAPEDPRIVGARLELLDALEGAAGLVPTDPWILGQRVRYSAEAGSWERAEGLARGCGPEAPALCPSLLGFTLHGQGRYLEAEEAFRAAIATMDGAERRRWTDPTPLLDDDARRHLGEVGPEGSEPVTAAVERLWRLADPLYLVPGNDRRTEHWARLTFAALQEGAANPYAMSWGGDLEEVLVRFGWEVGWDRVLDFSGGPSRGLVGHHHPESRAYLPPGRILRAPEALDPADWSLSPARPREGYTPAYAPVILPLVGEVLRFPRGERLAVVAVYRLPEDTTHHARHGHPAFEAPERLRARPVEAGLFLVPIERGDVRLARLEGASEGALLLDAPSAPYLASVEVWVPELGFAGRLRQGLTVPTSVPGAPSLSDLVLLERALPDDATLEDALDAVRVPGSVAPGERLVVGWELHGAGSREASLSYRLSLERTDRGLVRRVGEWLGLSDRAAPLRLDWEEGLPREAGPVFRTVTLEVPGLEPGRYRLRLELSSGGGLPVGRERTLRVEPP